MLEIDDKHYGHMFTTFEAPIMKVPHLGFHITKVTLNKIIGWLSPTQVVYSTNKMLSAKADPIYGKIADPTTKLLPNTIRTWKGQERTGKRHNQIYEVESLSVNTCVASSNWVKKSKILGEIRGLTKFYPSSVVRCRAA